jgi:predicted ABC-type ATPase
MPCIWVLAGTNGAGKSSIGGAMLRKKTANYFNPDEVARELRGSNPGWTIEQANAEAWQQGKALLQRVIADRQNYAFETTLGGKTMADLLQKALDEGMEVRIWYAGLSSPELHIARVRARVARGGHDIPDANIRKRYDGGRLNLIRLLPRLTELRLYDNSVEADPANAAVPNPVLVLHLKSGIIMNPADLALTPEWAKPIVAAAMSLPQS